MVYLFYTTIISIYLVQYETDCAKVCEFWQGGGGGGYNSQLLQLCMAHRAWSDLVIRPNSVRSGKFTTCMVTNEKQRKHNTRPITVRLILVY